MAASRNHLRTLALLLAGALLATTSPALQAPAAAAVGKRLAVPCRTPQCWPTAFTFTPDGNKIFYVERFTGSIRVYDLRRERDRRWGRIANVATSGEQGLLGIALDPRWPNRKRVFVYYTHSSPLQNRIVRLEKDGGELRITQLLSIEASAIHNGGVIHFGPDGYLYAVAGDAANQTNAQDTQDPAGSVLRMRTDGKAPAGNPFGSSRVFSYGHRNSFGFAFDPEDDDIWQSENGPECNDEVNEIEIGRNFGWGPMSVCPATNTSGPNPVAPKHTYTTVIAPTGLAFCDRCRLGTETEGTLLLGSWNDAEIRRLRLNAGRNDITQDSILFTNPRGILAIEASPKGPVFFSDDSGIYRLVQT
ncbi:MAG: PQQ-dependent sugar dehydrogenase [Actinomycetota bacterium]